LAPAEISTLAIDDADCVESPITVHIVRPLDPQRPSRLPVVVYAHGGAGWTAGDMATHERFVRELCYLAGAAIVFVECARSPEAPWPIAERQVAGVVRWVAAHGRRIGVDPTRMALAGDDGGAHVAVSVALRLAHERRAYGDGRGDAYEGEPPATRHPLLSALVLFCPLVRPPPPPHEARGSWARFADGAWFTADAARWAWEAYAPEPSAADLLSVPDPDLRVLPPTLVIAAGRDPSADDALSLAERLEGAGVPSETAVWPHAIHDFVVLNPLACSPVASEAVERAARFLAEHILF
jgi:acetyl esterase